MKSEWNEIIPDIDYRRELKHCTLRVARASKEYTGWVIEITVGLHMLGAMRKIIEASTPESAMKKTEAIAKERFCTLKHFYSGCLIEMQEAEPKTLHG